MSSLNACRILSLAADIAQAFVYLHHVRRPAVGEQQFVNDLTFGANLLQLALLLQEVGSCSLKFSYLYDCYNLIRSAAVAEILQICMDNLSFWISD